jgi:hypothetical protein
MRHSNHFEIVLLGFAVALAFLFQSIFEHLFSNAILQSLEKIVGIPEAEMITRLSEVSAPLIAVVVVIFVLYRFVQREFAGDLKVEDIRLRLADLRTEGVGLRNASQSLRVGIPEWIAKCEDWTARVIQTINEISPADAEWFKTLDAVPDPRFPLRGSFHPEQLKRYREHDFYLWKLEKLIKKY